ncbi:hypothetical protein ACF3NT_00810 [Naumannella halotolerans]|uniref:hypothetical protein n=1 Tax=Naumannella halotolerans TaxID=993414 RepID=UPI00370D7C61
MAVPSLRVPGQVAVVALRETLVVPVRDGHVDPRGWRRPLPSLIVGAYLMYAVLIITVLVSAVVVDRTTPVNRFDIARTADLPVALGYWFTMLLTYLASLGLGWAWRIGCWLVLLVVSVVTWLVGVFAVLDGGNLLSAALSLISITVGAILMLVATITGTRGELRWSTTILATLGLAGTQLAPSLISTRASVLGSDALTMVAALLIPVSVPLAVAAGTTFAQVAVNFGVYTFTALRDLTEARIWPVVTGLLAVPVVGLGVSTGLRIGGSATALTIGHMLITIGACWAAMSLAARRGASAPQPLRITQSLADRGMLFGLLLGSWGLLSMVDTLWFTLPLGSGVLADGVLLTGAVIIGVQAIRRADAAAAVLAAAIAVMAAFAGIRILAELPSLSGAVGSAALAVIAVALALPRWGRSGFTDRRWFVLALALLVLLISPYRIYVAEPLESLVGSSQLAVLLIGLVWLLLTEAEFTRRDSPRLPRTPRLLLFLAYAMWAATMTALVAHGSGSMAMALDLGQLAEAGDAVIGYAVAPAVVVGLLAMGEADAVVETAHPEHELVLTAKL